jgi:hypothetical protein
MIITHILLAVILLFFIWKLLKVTLSIGFWFFMIALLFIFISPVHFLALGMIGFSVLMILGGLMLISIISFVSLLR